MDYRFVALDGWPVQPTKERREGKFRSTYTQTLDLLDRELYYLDARNIVIQIALSPRDIRNDGRPRSDARKPEHPGIVLSFDMKNGPLSFPCDTFYDWKDNLRAIALSLEALRAVDRYGVTKRGEQYKGWGQLPPPSITKGTREEAADYLGRVAERGKVFVATRLILDDRTARESVIRAARKASHPDSPGGSHEEFIKVQDAIKAVEVEV